MSLGFGLILTEFAKTKIGNTIPSRGSKTIAQTNNIGHNMMFLGANKYWPPIVLFPCLVFVSWLNVVACNFVSLSPETLRAKTIMLCNRGNSTEQQKGKGVDFGLLMQG